MVLAAAAVILSASSVYAYPPCGEGPGDKEFEKKFGPGKEDIFKDLNLTVQQTKMLEENKNENKAEVEALFSQMKQKEAAMREELQKPKLDMTKITKINGELKKLQAEMIDGRLEGILAVRKILSPEQFKKFTQKMERHHRHGPEEQEKRN
jgi:Spy/CpxP family protein refolding chaperone